VSAFENTIDRNNWDNLEHRVSANIDQSLQVLSDHNVKATFFTLGWVAERYPNIITRIIENGHELASHGYGHQRVTDLDREAFKADLHLKFRGSNLTHKDDYFFILVLLGVM
jgi:peptidoglycan/xylan/chitin deacetylase (PgdA/CDA1 family)